MLDQFRQIAFRRASAERIALCNAIIAEYRAQDLRLTLRQLYYQLVSRNVVPNTERSYKALGVLVSDARLAGLMDWDAIEDRNRVPEVPLEFENLQDRVESALANYRLPRWSGQEYYVELWVEKAALAGVLKPLADEFHVTLMVNRGYSSQSAMYGAAQRFLEHGARQPVLLYLGDHDPSGEDMVRDIRDRLSMFRVRHLDVIKVALTMAQVEKYDPPPNPAKTTDSRAASYIAKHGAHSWEVDALDPATLAALVRAEFSCLLDMELVATVRQKEEADKARLTEAVASLLTGP